MHPLIQPILELIKWGTLPSPMIVSDTDACSIIENIKWIPIHVPEDVYEYARDDIYIIEWNVNKNDKKAFRIEDARRFIELTSVRGYAELTIFLLRDIDTATPEAANSLLKILEDTPENTLILITAQSHEWILDTIQSRTIFLSSNVVNQINLEDELIFAISSYLQGEKGPLLILLYKTKYERSMALAIVREYFQQWKHSLSSEILTKIQESILLLSSSNTSPRYILDTIFITL